MSYEGNLRRGLFFGIVLSIPLWMSLIGWMQML